MKCPFCNNEMQEGFVQCRDGVYWTLKKQKVPALTFLANDAIAIGGNDRLMPNSMAIAYHCETCKNVMISYGNK